jgi:hypothetical protein
MLAGIPLLAGIPPPDWSSDLLVWLGGKQIAPDGQIETLSGNKILKVEAQLHPHMNDERITPNCCAGVIGAGEGSPRT